MDQQAQIFKKQDAEDIFYGVSAFNFETLEKRAKKILDNAYAEAEAQIQRAAAEVDKIRADIRGQEFESARQEGYAKGFAEGRAKGEADGKEQAYSQVYIELKKAVETTPSTLKALIDELEAHRKKLTEEAEEDLLSLAFAIGERIARVKIETDASVVQKTIREAIDLVLKRNTLDVFIAPDDVHAIEEYLPQVRKMYSDIETLRIHAEERISRGSVEIHTARGKVAIHVDELIDSIANYLLGKEPSQVLERILSQFDGEETGRDDLNLPRNSDEIALAEALGGEYEAAEEDAKTSGTRVFMEDSFLENTQQLTAQEPEEEDFPAPPAGAMTRMFSSVLSDVIEAEPEDEVVADLFEEALGTAQQPTPQSIEEVPSTQDLAPSAEDFEDSATSDDPFSDALGELAAAEAPNDDFSDDPFSDALSQMAGDDAPVEADSDDPFSDALSQMAGDDAAAQEIENDFLASAFDESSEPASDDKGDDLDAALAELGELRADAKMDGDSALSLLDDAEAEDGTPFMQDSFLDDLPEKPQADAADDAGLSELDAALAELGELRSDAKMNGDSVLGLFDEEEEEDAKPFMQDSFLDDLLGD